MLGASRESLSAVRESVDSRRAESGFDSVSGELFAVADLLSRENTLRVALADSWQPEQARIALAVDIFGSRVTPLALDVVREVVKRRWSTDGDMLTAFETVASQAAFTVAETDGSLGRVEEELFTFGSSISAASELPCEAHGFFDCSNVSPVGATSERLGVKRVTCSLCRGT